MLALKATPIIWSVHDVTPASLGRCQTIVELLADVGVGEIAILIIPAGSWSERQLATLRRWEREGHLLGLHGWEHQSVEPRGIHHRLHSAVFSRDVAEHLGRPRSDVLDLVRRGLRWFEDASLSPPQLYVPPAWALGAMTAADVRGTPIRWIETLSGVYDAATRRYRHLPLIGFEADTRLRAWALRLSNHANTVVAALARRPVRAAIHPNDLELALSSDLRRLVHSGRPSAPLSGPDS